MGKTRTVQSRVPARVRGQVTVAIGGTTRRVAPGRVSDYVVRSARCPVLVVQPDGVLGATVP